jgi:hypothetical protein
VLDLETKKVDYTYAFLHLEIDGEISETGIYVSMPIGFGDQRKI